MLKNGKTKCSPNVKENLSAEEGASRKKDGRVKNSKEPRNRECEKQIDRLVKEKSQVGKGD